MSRCVIYHSHTGVTRSLAQKIKAACGADLIEVMPKKIYGGLSLYTIGMLRAIRGGQDPIEQQKIDVAGYDLVILGTPVWAGKPTPAFNATISALKGYEGRKAIVLVTCGRDPGQTAGIVRKRLEDMGMKVIGVFVFTEKDLKEGKMLNELIVKVNASMTE
ncbi:MAG: flavodoxin [Methanoregula sp. PtaU1.Bin051]|nr:MAG: flavodoxin [Methanoregula sp. PtaU1.Bin051]